MSTLFSLRRLALRLRLADRRSVALGALALQAVLLLLDLGSNAAISFAPFYSVPVALAAWRLNRALIAWFVLCASAARVLDVSMLRMQQGDLMLMLYDLLQSVVFYTLVAAATLKVRAMTERLATRAMRYKRQARLERQRRRMEAGIRRAVLADVPAIVHLTHLGGEAGAFDQGLHDSARQAALASAFRDGIVNGAAMRDVWDGGGQSLVPIEFWVAEVDGQLAGYMMVLGLDGNKGQERELHALAVDPAHRGHGVGAALVNFFCSRYQQRRLLVACRAGSLMMQMLKRRRFYHQASSDDYEIMALG